MTTPEICEHERLPIHFAYRILKKLEIAGLVIIVRGKDGGSRLAHSLDDITFFDLVKAMSGRKYISPCLKPGFACEYKHDHDGVCGVHEQLTSMQRSIDNIMKDKTLNQLISSDVIETG